MKAKDLIKVLEKNPDFEVKTSISKRDDSDWGFHVETYSVTALTDIGHSDRVIILNMEADWKNKGDIMKEEVWKRKF